jgi:hypothetical protein
MKKGDFWDVTLCGSCKNRSFGKTRRQVPPKRRFLQEPHGVTTQKTPFFIMILVTLIMEEICSSKMSVLARATWCNIPEDGILQ